MRPPRPAPIVAAAVLLLVVAAEVLVVGLGIVIALAPELNPHEDSGFLDGLWFGAVWSPIGAALLMMVGINLLRGRDRKVVQTGVMVIALGTVALLGFIVTCVLGLAQIDDRFDLAWFKKNWRKVFAVAAFVVSNIAMILIAGMLLRRHRAKYVAWRIERGRSPEGA